MKHGQGWKPGKVETTQRSRGSAILIFFYPQFKKLTGAERLILRLADYTVRRSGHEVAVLTHSFADECRPALGEGVRLIETGWRIRLTGNHYLDAAIEYLAGPALALRLPLRRVEGVVFFGGPSVPAMWFTRRVVLPLAGGRGHVPLLYFCFEPPRVLYSDTADIVRRLGLPGKLLLPAFYLYRALDRRMVRSAHRILANSPFGAQRIRDAYRRRAVVIEHGVDFDAPAPHDVQSLKQRYGLGGRAVAVTVNHLHPRKRIDLFLRAVRHASRLVPGTTALVVGGGPERGPLEQLARQLGMVVGRDVVFTGAVPEEELPAHYALGSVYVHTGREESFGLSVIEALRLGLPVVSVDEGGPRHTVQNGVSGYLVPAEPEALGEAIARLLADPQRARQMGQAGAGFVARRFRWERGADTLLSVLRQTASRL